MRLRITFQNSEKSKIEIKKQNNTNFSVRPLCDGPLLKLSDQRKAFYRKAGQQQR